MAPLHVFICSIFHFRGLSCSERTETLFPQLGVGVEFGKKMKLKELETHSPQYNLQQLKSLPPPDIICHYALNTGSSLLFSPANHQNSSHSGALTFSILPSPFSKTMLKFIYPCASTLSCSI